MKILLMVPFKNLVNRGTENFSTQMKEYFEKNGDEVLFIPYSWPIFINPPIFYRWPLKFLLFVALDPMSLSMLAQAILQAPKIINFKPDIYWPQGGFWQILICHLCKFLTGHGKIVVNEHAGVGHDELKVLLARPDVYAAQSPATLSWTQKFYKGRLELIPEQVDIGAFDKALPLTNINPPRPIILTVAALVPYKRVNKVIEAVGILGRGSLVVIGDGPEKGRLRELGGKLLGSERFQIISGLPHHAVLSYYRSADVFVLASTEKECFGRVILEAMAAGLPVVLNNDPIRAWISGETGILVDCDNPQEIAKGVSKALSQPYPNHDLRQFTRERVSGEYKKIFEELTDVNG